MRSDRHGPAGTSARGRSPAPATGAVLEVRNLHAGYGDLAAVRGVSFALAPGEIMAFLGANGAGKTTTLMATVGVLPRMSGTVMWEGKITKAPLHKLARAGIAFVPGAPSVISSLSARDHLKLGPGGVDGAVDRFPELKPLLNRPAGLLSGGEQQILSMGRALAGAPKVLLVDELSLGLAPLVVDRLLTAIRRAADDTALSVLLIEQQARRALTVADRWCLLHMGTITHSGQSGDREALEAAYLANLGNTSTVKPPRIDEAENPGLRAESARFEADTVDSRPRRAGAQAAEA
jgi:branched-chain amino acid transport system ATP-binding protein